MTEISLGTLYPFSFKCSISKSADTSQLQKNAVGISFAEGSANVPSASRLPYLSLSLITNGLSLNSTSRPADDRNLHIPIYRSSILGVTFKVPTNPIFLCPLSNRYLVISYPPRILSVITASPSISSYKESNDSIGILASLLSIRRYPTLNAPRTISPSTLSCATRLGTLSDSSASLFITSKRVRILLSFDCTDNSL